MINNAFIFIVVSITLALVSFWFDKEKTIVGLRKGMKMFKGIAVPFLNILILVSLALYLVPQTLIIKYLGVDSGIWGLTLAAVVGSIAAIPGFISYPIAATLIGQGASYTTVATFMTILMMVGVVTFPLEVKYLGIQFTLARTLVALPLFIAIGYFMEWYLKDKDFRINNL